jgi:hypothetical protein
MEQLRLAVQKARFVERSPSAEDEHLESIARLQRNSSSRRRVETGRFSQHSTF